MDNEDNEKRMSELNRRQKFTQPIWSQNEELLVKIAENFKLLEQENQKLKHNAHSESRLSEDKRKILNLYNYKTWGEFMEWINEKLAESGELQQEEEETIKKVLSEILEEPDFQQSYAISQNQGKSQQNRKSRVRTDSADQKQKTNEQLLVIENARLRRENIKLKAQLNQIKGANAVGKFRRF